MMSGGIDSPVAAHLMLSRGARVTLLNFDNRPFADDAELAKVRTLVERLRELHGDVPAYLVPHGETIQRASQEHAPRRLTCVLCKRMMLRVSGMMARRLDAEGVVTGDSLGQVASQTLANLRVEQLALGGVPAVRPLIGFDKAEVMRIAREIGTYDLSIAPSVGCTAVPSKPSVAARRIDVEGAEALIDIERLALAAVEGAGPI